MAKTGFFDLSDRYASLDAKRDPLVEIDAIVPWGEFRPRNRELLTEFLVVINNKDIAD